MPTPSEHFPLPLDLLIGRLEAAGFRVDTSQRLRVLRVFDDLGNPFVGGHFEELKYLLSPLVSRSPQEQERFYEIFDAFWRECEAEAAQVVEEAGAFAEGEKKADGGEVLAKPKKKGRRWLWWVAAGLITLTGLTLALWVTTAMYIRDFSEPTIQEGDTLRMAAYQDIQRYWEILDAETRASLHRDTNDLTWVAKKYGRDVLLIRKVWESNKKAVSSDTSRIKILCANPPEVSGLSPSEGPPFEAGKEYTFSIKTEPDCLVVWGTDESEEPDTFKTTATGISTFRVKLGESASQTTIRATVHRPEKIGYCYTERNFDLGNNKPILPLTPFQRAEGFSVFVISRLGWLLILLPLLLAGWFFYRWRKKRNTPTPQKTPEELADQYPVLDAGPYFIPYRSQEHSITVPREFFRIAELLRRREEGQRRYFDGPATVRATIESGGFPAWRERAVTRPSEYLFLVERPDERDQQGKLFTRLCDFLKRRDVPLMTFFHDGSFQHFWNAEYANGLPPNELRRRYPHHRLVLLGAAHGLVNPYATRQPELLRGPLDWLTHWPRRLLLTPEPVAAWSFQEALLHRHFLVFPADTEGILSGIDLLDRTEEYHAGRFERWQDTRAPRHSPETHRYRTWKTAADHADYLRHDPDCFRWLCALAVCAQPDWSLTLAIGRAIGVEVTHDRLLLLTRIPWLSQNLPNDGLRLELLRQLSPADEQAARQTVAQELEAVRSATANSFAETERTANAAVQNFALDPRDEAHKQAIRELRTLGLLSGSQEAELDFIVQEKADPSGLPNSASEGIEGWLDVLAPKRFWTRDMNMGLLSVLLSLVLVVALFVVAAQQKKPLSEPFDSLTKDVAQDNELVKMNERAIEIAERALATEDYEAWRGLQDSVRLADSLFQLVAKEGMISVSGGLTKLAQQKNNLGINLPIFRYNLAAKNFNFYQTEGLPADTLRKPLRGFEFATQAKGGAKEDDFIRRFRLDAQHGQGLCHYYLAKYLAREVLNNPDLMDGLLPLQTAQLDSARIIYKNISDNLRYNYFDSLQATMPVNLQTLLEAEKAKDKGDPADTDEAMRQKILGHWIDEKVRGSKNIIIFRKDGTATVLKYVPESNRLEDTGLGRWSVKNKALRAILGGSFTHTVFDQNKITYLDNNRLTLEEYGEVFTYRRIQPTDRDRDGVLDVVDNCPDEKGVAENGGCPENKAPEGENKRPTVVVSAMNKMTLAPLYGVTYRLIEIGGKGTAQVKISTQGESSVSFEVSGSRYKIVASKPDFSIDSIELSTISWSGDPISTKILYLNPVIPTVVLSAVNDLTKALVYGVTYRLIEIGGMDDVQEKTSAQGESSVSFEVRGSRYKIEASKPGFTTASIEINTVSRQINPTFTETLSLRQIPPPTETPLQPVTLYFDNDQPDPNTNSTSTRQAYQPLYVSYYRRKDEYIKQYLGGLGKGEDIQKATADMENFFERDVRGGWEDLIMFAETTLREKLERGEKVELTLRGYTAPRGSSAYNQNLSQRRISSVVNHFLTFDGAILKQFMDSGQLTFRQEHYGETLAPVGISENEKDLRRSVYSLEAMRENRVEIVEVKVKGKSKN